MRLIMLLLLASCASRVPFQKFDGKTGYTINKGSSNAHFKVEVTLPADSEPAYIREYAWIGTGIECHQRGFAYYETVDESRNVFHGLCYKEAHPRSMMLLFKKRGLSKTPPKFTVERVYPKPKTFVLEGDELLELDGKKVTSVLQMKLQVQAAPAKKTIMPAKLRRKGKVITVKEPIGFMPHQLDSVEKIKGFLPK